MAGLIGLSKLAGSFGMEPECSLKERYQQVCQQHGTTPLAAFLQVLEKASGQIDGALKLRLDHVNEVGVRAINEVLKDPRCAFAVSIDASNANLTVPAALELVRGLRGARAQVEQLSLTGNSVGRDTLRDLFQGGHSAMGLDLSCCRVRKVDIGGTFENLQTLKLDYNLGITHFPQGCFQSAPQLARLSLCGTSISNLHTTTAALGLLPKLVELRFQRCPCCPGTGACAAKRTGGRSVRTPDKDLYQRWRQSPTQELHWGALDDSSDDELAPSDQYSPLSDITMRTEEESESEAMAEDELEGADSGEQFPGFPWPNQAAPAVNPQVHMWQVGQEQIPPSRSPRALSPRSAFQHPAEPPLLSLGRPHWLQSPERRDSIGPSDSDLSSQSATDDGMATGGSCACEPMQTSVPEALERPLFFETGERLTPRRAAVVRAVVGDTGRAPGSPNATVRSPRGLRSPRSRPASERVPLSVVVNGSMVGVMAARSPPASPVPAKLHPAPICHHKFYRPFLLASLPSLKVLDNTAISPSELRSAQTVYRDNFEPYPNGRKGKESVIDVLQRRELGGSRGVKRRAPALSRGPAWEPVGWADRTARSGPALQRDLAAAAMGNSVWPALKTVCTARSTCPDIQRRFRPRQFEYNPIVPNLMVYGTLHGEVIVVNHETDEQVGNVKSIGAPNSILGLCWLNRDPNKLIAGSDNGSIQLFDVNRMRENLIHARGRASGGSLRAGGSVEEPPRDATIYTYENFDQLTSVHINCTDEYFLTSGYSNHVGLYNLCTGKRLHVFPDLHKEHINVLKFANHSPHLFVTSSFDHDIKMWDLRQKIRHPLYTTQSSKGNVMVCFSPDDHYLLASAVDNEVCQRIASDGRLHLKFDVAPINSSHNYTRSYYMNSRDYIVTGSCEENVVRLCCARTGRRLRDITFEGKGSKNSLYIQSLRGDPFRDFHFSVLAAYNHPTSKSEIVKVNLLSRDMQRDASAAGVPVSALGA